MRLAIGSDHAAFKAKQEILAYLSSLGHTVLDKGSYSTESCDYPDYAAAVSRSLQQGEVSRGILICGTGIGMSIAANRFTGVRAALCCSPELAILSRLHNNANTLCMGSRTQTTDEMRSIIDVWLATEWEGDRHARRLEKIESNARG